MKMYSPGSKSPVQNILDVDNVKAAQVPLSVNNHTRSSHVTSAGDHDNVAGLEFDVVDNLVLDKVKLDSVVDLDGGVGVTDGTAVVGENVRDTLGAELVLANLAKLESGLLGGDTVDSETALDVVEETEVLAGALEGDDVWVVSY